MRRKKGEERKALERIRRLLYLYAFSMLNQHPRTYLSAFYAFVDFLYIYIFLYVNGICFLFIVYFLPSPIITYACFFAGS